MTPIRPKKSLAPPVRAAELVAGVYDRVSQADAHDLYRSVDQQHTENSAACAEKGWTIGERYTDPNVSASKFSQKVRENWERLRVDLAAGKFQVLVLWEPSRGDRDNERWNGLLKACERHNVLIHITSHERTYDVAEPRDWKSLADDGADSEYETRKTSKRVRRDMKSTALAGKPHGKIPYGYQRIYNDRTKALVEQSPHPVRAEVVREIFRSVAQSVPLVTIARRLNERGIPAPRGKEWLRKAIRDIALNGAYIAKRSYQGALLNGNWTPLIDETTFFAAQQILTDPTRLKTRPGRQKYLLSFVAQCDVCGGGLYVAAAGPKQQHASYRCFTSRCPGVSVPMELLDDYVSNAVCERLSEPEPWNLMQADDSAVMQARADMDKWQAARAKYKELAKAGKMDPEDLAEMLDDLRDKIKAAEKQMERVALPLAAQELAELADVAREAGRPPLEAVVKHWRSGSFEMPTRRNIIRELCSVRLTPATAAPARSGGRFISAPGAIGPDRVKVTWLVN